MRIISRVRLRHDDVQDMCRSLVADRLRLLHRI